MNKVDDERLRKLATKLGYSYEELRVKGIEAMIEWVSGKDEKQIPEFLLEIRKRQKELKNDDNSKCSS